MIQQLSNDSCFKLLPARSPTNFSMTTQTTPCVLPRRHLAPRWGACLAMLALTAGCNSLPHGFSPELGWAPLSEGKADLQFKGVVIPAPMMASAGSTEKVTLEQSWRSLEWGKKDFSTWAMPLAGSLVQSGNFKVRAFAAPMGPVNQMLEAVLFLPSVHPNILLAMPDELPAQDRLLSDRLGKHQDGIRKLLEKHRLWFVPALIEYCPGAPAPADCQAARVVASEINNAVLVTRLVPDRDDLVVVTDGKVWPLGKARKITAGGKNFELLPVASEPGMLELRQSR